MFKRKIRLKIPKRRTYEFVATESAFDYKFTTKCYIYENCEHGASFVYLVFNKVD